MIQGILQHLTIIELSRTRLVLREWPLLEWLVAAALFILAINMAILGLRVTALVGAILGALFVLQARTRTIVFDAEANTLEIVFRSLYKRQTVMQGPLTDISRAYLHQADDGSTQIILVQVTGGETGLSVYSRDVRPWKEDIVVAINAILHEAHKEGDESDDTQKRNGA